MRIDTHLHIMLKPFCGLQPIEVQQLVDMVAEGGLDGGWISSIDALVTRDLEVQKRCNDSLADIARSHPGRLQGFGTVSPDAMDLAAREVERCSRDLGLIGIKLHPWLQSFSVTAHPGMELIMQAAASERLPVLFHDGTPPYSTPRQIALLAERHPRVQVILGHSGLLDLWRDAADAARLHDNIWLQPTSAPPVAIRAALDAAGRDRLLFGTDGGFGSSAIIHYGIDKFRSALGEDTFEHVVTANHEGLLKKAGQSVGHS